ncbi:MAG: Protein translocase subunit SecY [candidate division WWE3 bacterium GW2011_GWF2_42_42]|uniref:Protein translocase subunit SecY n=1 Tax=candidate division WWE3 bacterium GW2011_GWF2_42_42 TaxID=1619142 RepID=A0A0G1AEW8_UNCKA|nr:MAG: Protein translocase subunit SecY [candidate division WWE3 bacterium GW2011_GWF2_42_42]
MIKLFRYPEVRKKIIFTLAIIVIVDVATIRSFLSGNALFGMFDLFSGGGFQNFSIVTLGLGPYINASIIMQLLTVMVPSLEEMAKEGEYGRERINLYTKYLSVPMTIIQAYGIYFLLNKQGAIPVLSSIDLLVLMVTMSAGATFLVWLGDLVTERGVGNGVSLLIFVGIISRFPQQIYSYIATLTADTVFNALLFGVLAVVIVASVVLVNEGTRNLVIEYGRTGGRSQKVTNYLPLKINQAGVIPIIFAVSVVMVPSLLAGPLSGSANPVMHGIGRYLANNFSQTDAAYNILYFLLVVAFTFFYTGIQFNPQKIADDVKKRGGFIPGIRPGMGTARYLKSVVNRITLAGAVFLGLIAILPFFFQQSGSVTAMTVGGTSLLIVVSVVLETIRQTESLMVTRSYDKFLF